MSIKKLGLGALTLALGLGIVPSAHAATALTYNSADMTAVVTEVAGMFAGWFPTILILFAIGLAIRYGRRLLNMFHL